jgi:hypothetical protein
MAPSGVGRASRELDRWQAGAGLGFAPIGERLLGHDDRTGVAPFQSYIANPPRGADWSRLRPPAAFGYDR